MDKYPLIGVSIFTVVLLVLGSLSNVVGYQTTQVLNPNLIGEQNQVNTQLIHEEMTLVSDSTCDCDSNTLGDSPCDFPLLCAILGVLFKIVFNMPSPFPVPPLLLLLIYLGAIFDCDWPYVR